MANIACLGAQERVFGSNPGVKLGFTTNNNVSCCSLLLSIVQWNNALRAIFLATLTLFLRNLVLLCFLAERQRLEGVFGFLERKQCNQPNAAQKSLNIQIQSPCKQIRKQMYTIGNGCTRIYDFESLPYSLCLS